MMSVIEGKEVKTVWHDESGPVPLEEKRQNILRTLATSMSQLRGLEFDRLGMLHFDQGGIDSDQNASSADPRLAQRFLKPYVGPSYNVNYGCIRDKSFFENDARILPPLNSSHAYLRDRLEHWWTEQSSKQKDEVTLWELKGTRTLFSLILDYLPFSTYHDRLGHDSAAPAPERKIPAHGQSLNPTCNETAGLRETFVLAPPDFDYRNRTMRRS